MKRNKRISKKARLEASIACMLRLYKNMKDPDDVWINQQYLQAVRDCIHAFKVKGVIEDYDLLNGTFVMA